MDHSCYFSLVLLFFHAYLFVDALWSPAGKGLTSWLSFVMNNCDVVTFPLVSWVKCGAWCKRIYSYFHLHSNIHIYSLQYNHDEFRKKSNYLYKSVYL